MKRKFLSTIIATTIISASINPIIINAKANGTWIESNNNWWYSYADGSYAKSEYIDGYWLDESGWYDSTWNGHWSSDSIGWWYESNNWYPTNQWLKIDGDWYYFKSDGYMACNEWVGNYYIQSDGTMATNMWIGDYYVGSDGAWVPNKQKTTNTKPVEQTTEKTTETTTEQKTTEQTTTEEWTYIGKSTEFYYKTGGEKVYYTVDTYQNKSGDILYHTDQPEMKYVKKKNVTLYYYGDTPFDDYYDDNKWYKNGSLEYLKHKYPNGCTEYDNNGKWVFFTSGDPNAKPVYKADDITAKNNYKIYYEDNTDTPTHQRAISPYIKNFSRIDWVNKIVYYTDVNGKEYSFNYTSTSATNNTGYAYINDCDYFYITVDPNNAAYYDRWMLPKNCYSLETAEIICPNHCGSGNSIPR